MYYRSTQDVNPSRRSMRHARRRRGPSRRLVLVGSIVSVLFAVVIVAACWVGVRGLMARDALTAAIPEVRSVASSVAAQDFDEADSSLRAARARAADARSLVSDPVWRFAEQLPWLGANFTVVRELAEVTVVILDDSVRPVVDAARALDPASLRPIDGRLPLESIQAALATAEGAREVLVGARERVAGLNDFEVVDVVGAARDRLAGELDDVIPSVDEALAIGRLVPGMLGADGPRTYLIMFMNGAELRALGGTALSFTTVTLDKGAFAIGDPVPAGFNNFSRYAPGDLGPVPVGVEELYPEGSFGSFVPNNTMTPQFATAAQLTREMWLRDIGTPIDAVIGLDTTALSLGMRGIEPSVLSDGSTLSSETVVALLLNQVYRTYAEDPVAQDLVYAEAVSAIADRITTGSFDPTATIGGLAVALEERRLMLWSSVPEEQQLFADFAIDGAPPRLADEGPQIGVYLHENVGSKMNFYLRSAIKAESVDCSADLAVFRLTTTITNDLTSDLVSTLPDSILGNWRSEGLDPGVQRTLIYLFVPPGGTIAEVAVDGVPAATEGQQDGVNPATRLRIETPPQGVSTVTATLSVPRTSAGDVLSILTTPMVAPTPVEVAQCP